MLQAFYPGEYLQSAYAVDYDRLYREGYRGVIFDIDNTLVRHGEPADERAKALFAHLKELGFRACVLSNNKEPRVKMFCDGVVYTEYIFKAHKPAKAGYLLAMEKMGTHKENTLFVGDQIFTDIWGANRVGVRTMLVQPIHPKEEIQIVLKRYPEKLILFFYKRRLKRRGRKNTGKGSV